jgi:hypothetical protein
MNFLEILLVNYLQNSPRNIYFMIDPHPEFIYHIALLGVRDERFSRGASRIRSNWPFVAF